MKPEGSNKPKMPRYTPSEPLPGTPRTVVERMPRYTPSQPLPGNSMNLEKMPRYTTSKPARMNSVGGARSAGDANATALTEQLKSMIGMAVSLGENNGYFRYTDAKDIAEVKAHLAEHRLTPLALKHHPQFKAYADADQQMVVLVRGKEYFAIPPETIPAELFRAPGLRR